MQKIFTEVVRGDIEAVRARIEQAPELVHAVATGSPQKFNSQSLLQVAIRSDQYAIAHMLLDLGADPNFIDRGAPSGWESPVLLDAVAAAAVHSRGSGGEKRWEDRAFEILSRMLDEGADVTATDTHQSNALTRAALIANDVLPKSGEPIPPEQDANLTRIFDALVRHGADLGQVDPLIGMTMIEYYQGMPVLKYLVGDAD